MPDTLFMRTFCRGARLAPGALFALGLLLGACGPGRTPPPAPAPAERVEPSAPEPPPVAQAAPAEEEAAEAEDSELTVVIDPGGPGSDEGRNLAAAARSERERRRQAGSPTAVITDESLPSYATGDLTVATPAVAPPAPEGAAEAESPAVLDSEREGYWRRRVLEIRTRWRQAVDRVAELEGSAAELRRRFYAEDDPYYRDTQIKPAWDRALELLEENRRTIERSKVELEETLEEGRQAGALPGWLREGVELEPESEEEADEREWNDPMIYEATDPEIVDEDGRDGR